MSLLVGLFLCLVSPLVIAQNYTAEVLTLGKCPLLTGDEMVQYDLQLERDEKNNKKSVTGSAKLPFAIDDTCKYAGHLEIWTGVRYVHFMEIDGDICEILTTFGGLAFENFKKAVKPAIVEKSCKIPPNEYELNKFEVSKDDIDVQFRTNGKFKVVLHLIDGAGSEFACVEGELLITEKEKK